MDSSVYKYLIEKLISGPDVPIGSLPVCFTKPLKMNDRDAMPSLGLFLKSKIVPDRSCKSGIPAGLFRDDSFFHSLFLSAHKALEDVLAGADPSVHHFRPNGIQLVRFLTFCASDDQVLFAQQADASGCAMLCFLTEGMLYGGWCPNAFEGNAKRAAHSYFIVLKKSLHYASAESMPAVIGYLWGAWLLAQKTEGIRNSPSAGFSAGPSQNGDCETFEWKLGPRCRTYIVKKNAAPFLFYILRKCPDAIPHPFSHNINDGNAGLSIRVNNEAVKPVSMADFIEINRRKISGDKFIYNCTTDSITDISWTIAVLAHENTLYRIDILKFPEGTDALLVDMEMKLECATRPEPCGKNSFIGKGLENTVVRFLDTPLEFEFDRMEMNGLSVYKAKPGTVTGNLKIVTAWATGRGISAINETKLLGLYE